MEATTQVKLQSLEPYRSLFPKALNVDQTVKMGASVSDTVAFIPKVIRGTAWQVEKYVRQELAHLSPYQACEKLWHFVKYHIKYEADARGIEMVRSPRRFISDAKGDCDCGSTYIGACIFSLSSMITGIKSITLRITKYKKDYFQHIYPVVLLTNGTKIIMDFVVSKFNYEEPYTEKKDYSMELQYLDGIDDTGTSLFGDAGDALLGTDDALSELGKLLKKNSAKKGGGGGGIFKKKTPEQKQAKKEKRKAVGKKLLKVANVANKVNPGAALLRAGVLAAMKTNLMKVAESIRWGYATREHAQSKGMDMSKYDKVKAVLAKTEKIFFGAGGKPDNLKKAILTGRGNRDKGVAGLDGANESTPISELLGDIYRDEFVNGLEGIDGFEGFGAVAAGAAVAAASSAMGALAALIKNIGNLFPGKKKRQGGNDESPGDDGEGSTVPDPGPRDEPEGESFEQESEAEAPADESEGAENLPVPSESEVEAGEDQGAEAAGEETTEGLMGIGSGIKNFYQKHKKWFVPVGIAVLTISAIAIVDHYASKNKPLVEPHYQPVNGPPTKRGRSKKGGKKGKGKKHEMIALM